MKNKINLFILLIALTVGSVTGILLSQENAYANNCEDLACKYDFFGGFRCFDDGTTGYNCNDSQYPTCTETACTGGGDTDPIEN